MARIDTVDLALCAKQFFSSSLVFSMSKLNNINCIHIHIYIHWRFKKQMEWKRVHALLEFQKYRPVSAKTINSNSQLILWRKQRLDFISIRHRPLVICMFSLKNANFSVYIIEFSVTFTFGPQRRKNKTTTKNWQYCVDHSLRKRYSWRMSGLLMHTYLIFRKWNQFFSLLEMSHTTTHT